MLATFMTKYKGYVAHIEYDEEDRIFVGHLAGIKDMEKALISGLLRFWIKLLIFSDRVIWG